MRIDIHTLQRNKTKVTLLENTKVNKKLAEQFAIADEKKSPDSWLSVKDYKNFHYYGFGFIYKFLYMLSLAAISTASLNVRLCQQGYPGRSSNLLFTGCPQNQTM